ncbi:UNVERIFIED_CONTAM: hypothetical protein Scaly_0552200 [Sesamum calycinum]|uniref:Tryptophan/tyrosine permease n=1 Tax=Sesamum calycinum TaxID=2727403 RepID=A0AAW2RRA9_9LAMI
MGKTPSTGQNPLQTGQDVGTIVSSALFGRGLNCPQLGFQWRFSKAKKRKFVIVKLRDEGAGVRKKGSVAGAVALIVGTSIGLLPSSISLTMCWAFLLIEALLLVEINVGLLRKKKTKAEDDDNEFEVISIRTMAEETLGEWGGALATVTLFAILISVGGTRATDQVNQWLTVSMIGLLAAIEVLAVLFGGWSGFEGSGGDWGKVPATLPVMIFALVYHDLAPFLCAYLEGDLTRIRTSVLLGSVVPLLALLIWEAIALGLSNQADQASDPIELLLRVEWGGVPFMVEAFSLLAVGTSIIGTLLSFSKFFKEQLNNLSSDSSSGQLPEVASVKTLMQLVEKNKASVTATVMVVAPSVFVSTTVPDAFSAATDIAGGYCMTMLYGVLPPAMAWAMNKKQGQETEETAVSRAGPALVGVGLFACGIVVEQILQDFSFLHP